MSTQPVATPRIATHVVGEEDAGERADVVLGRRVPALSRRLARNLARSGSLRIDGRRSPPSTRVAVGARLELDLDLGPEHEQTGIELEQLEVLALTERFVYVRKPTGVHVVALTPSQPGVLATAVAARFPECADASVDPREGGAVHRLDLPTSGVVAFARSREIWLQARAGFADERVTKHYLAVSTCTDDDWPPPLPEDGLHGWIEPGPALTPSPALALAESLARVIDIAAADRLACAPIRVRAALGRDGSQRSRVSLDGRRASTIVQPLARSNGYVLSHLLLETGCRHQARVHLAWIGRPIRGDTIYGPPPERMRPSTIALHAFALDLSAVFADEGVILAPPPMGFWPPEQDAGESGS
jgi:23S rRNA pseudouridine1911/1915/1917 synthase